jgi:hypothetical protein
MEIANIMQNEYGFLEMINGIMINDNRVESEGMGAKYSH